MGSTVIHGKDPIERRSLSLTITYNLALSSATVKPNNSSCETFLCGECSRVSMITIVWYSHWEAAAFEILLHRFNSAIQTLTRHLNHTKPIKTVNPTGIVIKQPMNTSVRSESHTRHPPHRSREPCLFDDPHVLGLAGRLAIHPHPPATVTGTVSRLVVLLPRSAQSLTTDINTAEGCLISCLQLVRPNLATMSYGCMIRMKTATFHISSSIMNAVIDTDTTVLDGERSRTCRYSADKPVCLETTLALHCGFSQGTASALWYKSKSVFALNGTNCNTNR